MDMAIQIQIVDGTPIVTFRVNTFAKGMNPYSTPAANQIGGQTGLFKIGTATSLEEGKLWIQTSCTPLKNRSCFASTLCRKNWVNTYI